MQTYIAVYVSNSCQFVSTFVCSAILSHFVHHLLTISIEMEIEFLPRQFTRCMQSQPKKRPIGWIHLNGILALTISSPVVRAIRATVRNAKHCDKTRLLWICSENCLIPWGICKDKERKASWKKKYLKQAKSPLKNKHRG